MIRHYNAEDRYISKTCPPTWRHPNHQEGYKRSNTQAFINAGYDACTKAIHKTQYPNFWVGGSGSMILNVTTQLIFIPLWTPLQIMYMPMTKLSKPPTPHTLPKQLHPWQTMHKFYCLWTHMPLPTQGILPSLLWKACLWATSEMLPTLSLLRYPMERKYDPQRYAIPAFQAYQWCSLVTSSQDFPWHCSWELTSCAKQDALLFSQTQHAKWYITPKLS